MAITKETEIAKMEVVTPYKHVQVAIDTIIKEDDVEISRKRTNRYVLTPDQDISGEAPDVQAVCNAVWTDDVKASWLTFKESQNNL